MTQSSYNVAFASRQNVELPLPPELNFAPQSWSWSCMGGPTSADIVVTGGKDALKELRRWLGYRVQINTNTGTNCWWGYVHEIELQFDGLTLLTSFDTLRNRIKTQYTTTLAGGGEADTGWLEDTASQSEYGIKEYIASLGDASPAAATAYTNRLLDAGAWPGLSRSVAGNAASQVTLRCRGWFGRLEWRYYQRLDGKVENVPEASSAIQPIGWGVSGSSLIGMGGNALQALGDYFSYFSQGHRLVVTGCSTAGNNQTYTVSGSTNEEVVTHTDTLTFEIDDINDGNGDLVGFKEEHWVWVTGSVQNDRWHWIEKADADHIEIKQQIAGELDPEGPTSNVTLRQPQKIVVDETNYTEDPSYSSKTIVHKGFRVFQKVTLASGMYVSNVFLWLGKTGAPADNLNVEIYTDVAGTPTVLKTSGAVAGTALLADTLEETAVSLTRVWLAAGDYDIIVWRSNGVDAGNHYLLGMSTETYLTTKQWDGVTWSTMEPAWSIKFRLWGVDDVGTQAETLVAAIDSTLTLSTGYTAGVDDYTYMLDIVNAYDRLGRLLATGTATTERIVANTTEDLSLTFATRDAYDAVPNLNLYTANGITRFAEAAGGDLEPGVNVAGKWVVLADLDDDLASETGVSPAFVEAATFDAETETWSIVFENERKISDILRIQG